MLSQDIANLARQIGIMAAEMPGTVAERVDVIQDNLFSIASQVRQLEAHFLPGAVERETRQGGIHVQADH